MFHYHYLPTGEYFDRARPMLTLHKVPLVETVFGRPVAHYAHRADVVRLQVLQEYGGIYLDLDLIPLKPVDHLLKKEFVMAQEGVDGSIGLCNAMIMSKPQSRFVQRWYSTYSTFDSSNWNYHSVILPGKLAPFFPNEVTLLNHTAFFWPLWDSHGLRTLYLEKSYDFSSNLGTHIWESAANKNLMRDLSEDVIMNIDNSLYCQLRPFLLDGNPDPRPGSCEIIKYTKRSDGLIGHWALSSVPRLVSSLSTTTSSTFSINPLPAEDDSGNALTGIIRNGRYINSSIYLSGDASYIFLSLPTETRIKPITVSWWMRTEIQASKKMAMVLQTNQGRICVTTHYDGALSLKLDILHRNEAWQWAAIEDLGLGPIAYTIDGDYHHYVLVLDANSIAFYMDGNIAAKRPTWSYPQSLGTVVHGVWFGSIEPLNDHYQDPWDTTSDLEAFYTEIYVYGRPLDQHEAMQLYTEKKPKKPL
ncbi:hypothetical protein BDF20DRAFT_828546 [Mycotypha africana]|uniref:uncharacterized protein n=1 Tax=Mycotypha africana TaxID=64632 RepID=UPI002301FE4C|nr:uncharacterized protein BDF20DRAFT_828546 [Mycotypha africana]KAI8967881.1 hypothetical protein BDF20DRAFT_828546 [Mycotypha africana]